MFITKNCISALSTDYVNDIFVLVPKRVSLSGHHQSYTRNVRPGKIQLLAYPTLPS